MPDGQPCYHNAQDIHDHPALDAGVVSTQVQKFQAGNVKYTPIKFEPIMCPLVIEVEDEMEDLDEEAYGATPVVLPAHFCWSIKSLVRARVPCSV
jgi:hypothetical protein